MEIPAPGSIEIAPSILSADFADLGSEIADVKAAGVKMVHLDVMDGHFVPNISIGPVVVASIRKCTDLFLDTHLMITDPGKYAEKFIQAGADHITFHIEAEPNPEKLIDDLHRAGCSAGIYLNPNTPVKAIPAVPMILKLVPV